jgi:hypothetical protein
VPGGAIQYLFVTGGERGAGIEPSLRRPE